MPLQKLKRWPTLKRFLQGKFVRIWSQEYGCWWCSKGCGLTTVLADAGVYDFEDAFSRTSHCGPEKGIVFQVAEPEYAI